jgi:hypothetical protein
MGELAVRNLVDLFRTLRNGPETDHTIVGAMNGLLAEAEQIARFPEHAVLLWEGCRRQRAKYTVPLGLAAKLRRERLPAVNRSEGNGPVHTAYRIAGGKRIDGWQHDHIYDGKHGLGAPRLHATADPRHFTQSAGIVLVPEHVHTERPRSASLSWFFRGLAYLKFGYDPERVFCDDVDNYGFTSGASYRVFWSDQPSASNT